ncbi:MAG: general secretion pathway protein GspF [Deltaproteobacteria bacterium]|nr:general secretion pathway protein GspF [Deltaproteobacteria bacterium]
MPIFHYQALDPSGTLHKGSQDATTETEVRQFLREKQWSPTEIRTSRFTFSHRKSGSASKTSFKLPKLFSRSNHQRSLTLFTRQIEVLLDATIPYDKAFQLIIPQTQDPKFQSILSDVRGRVVEGKSLAGAMAQHPEAFPAMYVSMVRSGENGGTLGVIMRRLAEYFEQQEQLRGRLRSAMIYPAFMTVFGIAVVAFMVTAVVPKIAQIFEAQEAALPLPTRILLGLSEMVTQHWWALLLGFGLIATGFSTFWKSPIGQRWQDRLELTLPGLSRLRIKILVARFCQTLGLLLKSGVDLKTALEISKHVVVNRNFIARLDQLIIDVHNKGMPLSAAMARIELFPEYVRHVVAIGEEAARLDELLERVAERMQEEIGGLLEGLTALLQPALILLMGGVVGFIALAVLLPMLSMNQLLR